MMESMAPSDVKGYEPAHTWLAGDLLQRLTSGMAADRQALNHHLAIASDWSGTNPALLAVYSQLLESEKRSREAIGMMQRAANREPSHYLALASLFARYKQPIQAKEAVERAVQHFSASFGKKDEPDYDRIAVAEAYLQIQKLDEAIKVLQQGLAVRLDRPALRRALSNVYRIAYRMQLTRSEDGIQANLNLLNAALAADPTNPLLGEEVALLQPMGIKPDDQLIQTLQKQLAAGTATAITHVLLGNAYYARNDLKKAQIHWELALGQDPNCILAINNLAMAMALKEKPDFDRAMELVDRALTITKDNPEVLDSKGEILALMGKHLDAIPFFENAIRLGPYRVLTREKLARSYDAAGLQEQSQAQWDVIEKIKTQVKKNQEEAAKLQESQREAAAAIAAEAEAAAAKAASEAAVVENPNPPKEPMPTEDDTLKIEAEKQVESTQSKSTP
jgi:tetratricopeptide (TPR) repeat protein